MQCQNAGEIQKRLLNYFSQDTHQSQNSGIWLQSRFVQIANSEEMMNQQWSTHVRCDSFGDHNANLEIAMMLSGGEGDAGNAIISIHPGASWTEGQDWTVMLYS